MVATVARWVSSAQSNVSTMVVDISGIEVGESMLVAHNIGSTSVTIATPDGWTPLFVKTALGSRACIAHYRKKASSAEVSVEFIASASTGWSRALIGVLGADPVDWIVGPLWTRSLHGTSLTNVVDGVTTTVADSLALILSFEATTALESPNSISGVNNGFAELGYRQQDTIIETIWAGTKSIPVAGDVGDTTVTYRNTQASNGAGIMIGFPPGAYLPTGVPVKMGDGSTARLSFIDALDTRRGPASVRVWKPGFLNAGQFILTPGATMAHRGGSESFPDMSEYGYDQSVLRGFGALEFSAQRSLDGWWFGLHDPSINAVSGQVGLPNASQMTRAEIEAYANIDNATANFPSRPFFGLEEFLEKYGKTHVLMLDPKNAISYNTEFMAICEGIVNPNRLIWKYYLGGLGSNTPSDAALAALNRGWGGTWGYAYDTNVIEGSFAEHAGKAGWTILGMNNGADQEYWDAALAIGKPLIGHIANTQESYNEGMSKGANMIQCSDITTITPVSI